MRPLQARLMSRPIRASSSVRSSIRLTAYTRSGGEPIIHKEYAQAVVQSLELWGIAVHASWSPVSARSWRRGARERSCGPLNTRPESRRSGSTIGL